MLLDLSGHTAHSRLSVFAWRPAPVQASWLGYFATTGLPAMDWVIADHASVPEPERAHFSERIWYLPGSRLCFAAPVDAPELAPATVLARGHITFGSFQHFRKLNDQVLEVWSAVLAAVPGARLRLQNAHLADAGVVSQLIARLRACGIDPARVDMHPQSSRADYLLAHGEVDILLDTFPYPGGTTTCEALWMGVPTLTLDGDRMLSRQGASLLAAAGLPGWIASSPADYVARARAFAGDPAGLAELRRGLRGKLAATALFDCRRFAGEFTEAMWQMAGHA